VTYLGTASGNFTTPGTSAEIRLECQIDYTQDIAGNYSDVSWIFRMVEFVNASPFNNNAGSSASLTVEVGVFGASNLTYNFDQTNETIVIASGTRRVYHNADGTKTGVALSGSYNGQGGTPLGSASFSTSFDLPTIPRASTPTYSPTTVDAGASLGITTNRADASFTHDLERRWSGDTGAYTSIATGVGASTSWTVPSGLVNDIPNATSRVLEIRTTTKQGATVIGTSLTYVTVHVPDALVPDLGTVTNSEATTSPNVASLIGAYVQSYTKLLLNITSAVAGTGATIVQKYVQVISGATILQTVDVLSGAATTPVPISASGTITLRGVVVDSRGRSYSEDVGITVLAYATATVTSIGVQRALSDGTVDENGTYIRLNLNAAVQSLLVSAVQKNALTYKISTSPAGANTWTVKATTTPGGITFNSHAEVGTYLVTASYDVKVEIYDKLSSAAPLVILGTISTAGVFVHFGNSGQGVGIGKYWEAGRGSLDMSGRGYQRAGKQIIDYDDVATESVRGVAEVATTAETTAETDDTRIITPLKLAQRYSSRVAALEVVAAKFALHRMFSVGPTTYNPLPTSDVTIGSDIVIPAEATYDRVVEIVVTCNMQINGANEAYIGVANGANTMLSEAHGVGANAINNTRWSLVAVYHSLVPAGSAVNARTFRMRGRANNTPVAVAENSRMIVTVKAAVSGDS
jgi:hypothetical protein